LGRLAFLLNFASLRLCGGFPGFPAETQSRKAAKKWLRIAEIMKKQFFSLLLLLSFVVSVASQEADLRRHVEYLASEKLAGRRTGTEGATTAAGYIANMFAKFKLKPGVKTENGKAGYLQRFPFAEPADPANPAAALKEVDGYNVVGILEGRDPVLKNEAIVIGAHYDHLGRGGKGSLEANSTDVHHGADDNASGTAAVIELARQFAKEKSNKRTLIFIAFSGEESGLFGSKYYVNNPVHPIENTVAMINLDMVGRLTNNKLTVGGIGTATEWRLLTMETAINQPMRRARAISSSGERGAGKVKPADGSSFSVPPTLPEAEKSFELQLNEDGFGPSDHSSFYSKNIPVLFLFTGTHLDYHKPTDTFEKINYLGLEKVVDYVAALAKAIDQNQARPTYAVAKSSGMGGRTGFNISLGTIPSYTESTDGMVIDGVRDNSPAAKAGLKGGDKIVMLAGKDIKNVQDYTKMLGEMKADVEYEVVVVRGSDRLTLKITPVKR
jgi:aminopeptidase YwaD